MMIKNEFRGIENIINMNIASAIIISAIFIFSFCFCHVSCIMQDNKTEKFDGNYENDGRGEYKCNNTKQCYAAVSFHYVVMMGYKPRIIESKNDIISFPGERESMEEKGVEYGENEIVVGGLWLDRWADMDCIGHCNKTTMIYHIIDIAANEVVRLEKAEALDVPVGPYVDGLVDGSCLLLNDERKSYCIYTYVACEEGIHPPDAPDLLDGVFSVRYDEGGQEKFIPLSLD